MMKDSWGALKLSYFSYRKRPSWTGWGKRLPLANGRLSKADTAYIEAQGRKAMRELAATIRALREAKLLPARPSELTQVWMNKIIRAGRDRKVRGVKLATLWEAVILARANYTCVYCGRCAKDVYRLEGKARTIRMVVDHIVPRRLGGKTFSFKNGAAACWSCNLLKSGLPEYAFVTEVRSLAPALAARYGKK